MEPRASRLKLDQTYVLLAVAIAAAAVGASCVAPEDPRPADLPYLSAAIFAPNCATSGCHSRLARTAGLVLDTPEAAYVNLAGGPWPYVVPYQPENSQLVALLRGEHVSPMPPDAPLPEQDVLLVERWILEGASPE